jgi:predicted transcriptional regulator
MDHKGYEGLPRSMSHFDESVLRLVHHEFAGMTQEEAAKELKVDQAKVSRAITDLEERAKTCKPLQIMFPILTKHQFVIYKCLMDRGLSTAETAVVLDTTESAIDDAVTAMRDKGAAIPKRTGPVEYHSGMDKDVVRKF